MDKHLHLALVQAFAATNMLGMHPEALATFRASLFMLLQRNLNHILAFAIKDLDREAQIDLCRNLVTEVRSLVAAMGGEPEEIGTAAELARAANAAADEINKIMTKG